MLSNRHHQLQIGITYRSTHVKSRQVVHLCYLIDIMTAIISITYRSTHVKSRQVVRLCYPIDIMTATNWNNLQMYQCKNQEGGMFMLSIRNHDSYKLE